MTRQKHWSGPLLWTIYFALLLVLLPHTAWAFARFEPTNATWLGINWGMLTAWAAAFAFEAAIAALTHKLAERIASTPNSSSDNDAWMRFKYQYLNAYAAGLFVTIFVSGLANFGHAVEYGQPFAIFDVYGVPPLLFSVAFGGILPFVSLLFARILADAGLVESQPNQDLTAARETIAALEAQLGTAEADLKRAEAQAKQAEQRFDAAGELIGRLFAAEKRQRILAVSERWPQLPAAAIAVIAEASPSYVSEVLKSSSIN